MSALAAPTAMTIKTIVVADDTAFVRDRFRGAIEGAGHRALTVATGPELLATLRAQQVDLVVLDLRLPSGRGLEMVRAIRRLASPPAAILVFSGTIKNADEVYELAGLGVGGYVNEYTTIHHIVPSLAPHLFPDQNNRRTSPRVLVGIPVSYRFGNTIASALTLNVSSGGIAVRTTSPLEVGTMLKVRLRLPGTKREPDVDARVAWVDRRVGMGMQFLRVGADDQAAIDGFVNRHFFSNRKA
jgi:uncharacterized protein (TIGR02266 family)